MFVDLTDKDVLLVGGGKVATRKLKTLLLFNPKMTVVAKKCTKFIKKLSQQDIISLHNRAFNPMTDIKDREMVIVAVDDLNLQRTTYELCKKSKIPINCVDSPDFCSFIFPSVIVRDDFVIGISTSGKAPLVSRRTREVLEKIIPGNINKIVRNIEKIRQSNLEKDREKEKMERYLRKLKWNCSK